MSAANHLSQQFSRIVIEARSKGAGHDDSEVRSTRLADEEDQRMSRKVSQNDEDVDEPYGPPMSSDVAQHHNNRLNAYWHNKSHQDSPEVFGSVGSHCSSCVRYGLA